MTLALDRHAEKVRGALQERQVVLHEFVFRSAVYLQNSERLSVTLQDDVHGATDAVLLKHCGRSETLFDFEMIGNNRFAGSQGISRRRSKISADACDTDDSWTPPDSGADKESVFPWNVFENLAEFGAQSFCRQPCRVCEQLIEGGALERDYAQLREYFLLPDTLLQGA